MMRVLAVTLGRSLRPRHNNDQDNQRSSSTNRKEAASHSLLISSTATEKPLNKCRERDAKDVRKDVRKDVPRIAQPQYAHRPSMSQVPSDREKRGPTTTNSTFNKDSRDSTRSTKSLISSKGGKEYSGSVVRAKGSCGEPKMISKPVESFGILLPNQGNEAKSARVARIPRETMCAHRSKLVRNSSLSKWRAKFRRQPSNSDAAVETDTEQLLDDSEEGEKPKRLTNHKDILVSHKLNERNVIDYRSEPSSSSTCSSSGSSSKNSSSYGSVIHQTKSFQNPEPKKSSPSSLIGRDVGGWVFKVKHDEGSWSIVPPPPRCLTPHRAYPHRELAPWVDPAHKINNENPYYLNMGGRPTVLSSSNNHINTSISNNNNNNSNSNARASAAINGGPASLPYLRPHPQTPTCSLTTRSESLLGSWPRPSRANGAVAGGARDNAGRTQGIPGAQCVAQGNNNNNNNKSNGSKLNTTSNSSGVHPSQINGSYSHFGTFPRRRPVHKDFLAGTLIGPLLSQDHACGTSEAAQLEQRLRSLGCELVTLRSRLPPSLHHSAPAAPQHTPTNNTNATSSTSTTAAATATTATTTAPANGNNPSSHNTPSSINTNSTASTNNSTTNNNKNSSHGTYSNSNSPQLPPNYPLGSRTPTPGSSDAQITPNNSTLADPHNASQSFLADGVVVRGGGMAGGAQELEDLIHLAGPLTEDAVLKTLHARFCQGHYFTNVGPILLSVNPYHELGNALTLTSTRAAPQSPHLLRVVHEAVRQQSETGYPQAIILSGASGSGKTYTSMLLLRQLFDVAGGGPETDAFKHLAAAFTVLRSLGSAKTGSNSESSRIGHFIEVQVTDGALYRTKIHCYFLDQTRVVRPLPDEKNYHIFYQMLAGLTQDERAKLHLEGHNVRTLRYLSEGDVRQDEAEDARRFESWKACLGVLGIPFLDVVRVLAAVLLLGNVTFIEGQGLEVDIQGGSHELKSVAALLGVSSASLYRGLTTRTHNVRGQLVKSMCDANMSNMTRDALAKALYCRTVATIVRRANSLKRLGSTSGTLSSDSNESVHHQAEVASQHASTVGTAGSKASKSMSVLNNAVKHATDGFIGILDMFGFEDPKPSHLEHLCINLCAETMQHFYNTHIFKSSIESCREEGITCEVEVDYVDNVPCIDLISSLRTGLLSMLDVEGSVRGTPESYIQKVKVQHKGNARLYEPKANHSRSFGIHHFASRVVYDASDFLDTNRDIISDDLVCAFHKQSCNFGFATHLFGSELKALFSQEPVPRGVSFRISPTSHTDLQNGDEPVSTLTQDFHTRLDNLLRTLVHAKPHFIRCIRSNGSEKTNVFDRATVIKQIRALQVLETVNLMAGGYPHRMRFKTFNMRYRLLAPFKKLRRIEDKTVDDCKLILEYFVRSLEDISKSSTVAIQWALGKRHIFLSEGARQQLEMLRIETRHRAATLIQAVWRGWHFRRRWPTLKRNLELRARSRTVRPRPQPIAGTPPPDVMDRCDQKTIQQTCSLFGLDLERPPPVPPSRSYTITGNHKMGYPQTRLMKMNFPEDGGGETVLMKGESVVVIGASPRRGHLLVDHQGHSVHVPFQYMELKPSAQPGVNI